MKLAPVSLTCALAIPLMLSTARAADTHDVTKTDGRAPVGQPTKLAVAIQGKNGWHVNEEAPISLKLTPGPGVAVTKPSLARADLAESKPDRARFDIEARCDAPGPRTITAEARFVMCQESACKPVKETLTLALEGTAAAKEEAKPVPAVKPAKGARKGNGRSRS
jgi:hypothetical protein